MNSGVQSGDAGEQKRQNVKKAGGHRLAANGGKSKHGWDTMIAGLTLLALLIVSGCVFAPIVYNEGLPAYVASWPPEGSGGMSLSYFRYGKADDGVLCFNAAARTGQRIGLLAVEEGIGALLVGEAGVAGPFVGIGIERPAVLLRFSGYPLYLAGDGPHVTVKNAWWQVHLLGGTPHRRRGLGFSLGGCASRLGIGPVAMGELAVPDLTLRFELSTTTRAPWADSSLMKGRVISLGFTAAAQPVSSTRK